MYKNLVIVESPAKAKTIEKYLGSDFKVLSSVGHIRSIPKKAVKGKPPIDIKNGFETQYEIDPEKKKVITELKKAVKTAETVWLATDEDREGEAIAWHLCEVLGLDPKKTNRIVFHEITKPAIEEAVKNPRTVDMSLVAAQQARQILDRIVGFELSPVVWQKVPGGKSAGRVQSPAVRLLVEREREIASFESNAEFKITAEFEHGKDVLKAELPTRYKSEQAALSFLESLQGASYTATNIQTTPGTRNPGAPFTTSTLQQEANSRLGFSSKATMSSAQRLYQAGKITYMRTDSVNLSKQAIAAAAAYIEKTFGKQYVQIRTFKTKSASAQEAHEAIRPTDMSEERATSDEYDQKLYDLIRRRTLSSQMSPAKLEKTVISIAISPISGNSDTQKNFESKGEVVIFDGFLRMYGRGREDAILPSLNSGDSLLLQQAIAKQIFARPPARYSEGSLVKKLEELGIGRPSTYATIINTVQVRGYAIKGESEGAPRDAIVLTFKPNTTIDRAVVKENTGSNKGKLVPTSSGDLISNFLTEHFTPIVDYGFTASVEEGFDKIAADKLERNKMLADFYNPFHELVQKSGAIDRSTVAQAREVGVDPKTGKPIFARIGRFGPLLQIGSGEDKEEKLKFAPAPKGIRIEDITLEQALHAFELPRVVGTTEDGQEIRANIGRFGPYIQVNKLFVSIKPQDPRTITEAEARQLYADKLQADAEKNIADFGDGVKILKGRYGPYISDGKKNAKIPKGTEPKDITHEQALKLLAEAPATKSKRPFTRRKK